MTDAYAVTQPASLWGIEAKPAWVQILDKPLGLENARVEVSSTADGVLIAAFEFDAQIRAGTIPAGWNLTAERAHRIAESVYRFAQMLDDAAADSEARAAERKVRG